MSQTIKAPRKAPAKPAIVSAQQTPEMLPATCELPAHVHAKVSAAAKTVEQETGIKVSFAAQLRKIVMDWAAANGGASR